MYRFQFEYAPKDYESLSRLAAKTFRKRPIGIRRAISALIAVGYLISGVFWIWRQRWVAGAVLVAVGIFFAVMTVFWHPLTARRMKKASLKGVGAVTVELEEKGMRSHHQKGESFWPYDAIVDAYHYRERYFFTLDDRQALILPETALIEGDATLLKAFLQEKLGKEIKEIH